MIQPTIGPAQVVMPMMDSRKAAASRDTPSISA